MSHIYETASFNKTPYPHWKEDKNQKRFFGLMRKYKEKIEFEASGHDHRADFRFHALSEDKSDFFLNKIIFPSITPNAST